MNEYIISLSKKELEYLLNSLKYTLYICLKRFAIIDDYKILEIFDDKNRLSSVLTKKEIEHLKDFDYFKKLDLYLKLRKKVLGF